MHPVTKSPSPAAPLLAWFDRNKRILPFRQNKTPYRVWVSEIMLQQTRVSAALPYYERFMAELPDAVSYTHLDVYKRQSSYVVFSMYMSAVSASLV